MVKLNFDVLRAAAVTTDPFPHFLAQGALSQADVAAAIKDFPRLDMAGLFLPEAARYGPAFAALLDIMRGPELRATVAEKLQVDLADRPTMVTVRACAQAKDGRIHADSKFKLATVLLYLNEPWEADGGRLRLLRSPTDLEDYVGEVPPHGGTLVCFKVTPNSWHGHKPFVGPRRYVMLNYCQDESVRNGEEARHRMSGRLKKAKRLFGVGKVGAASHG